MKQCTDWIRAYLDYTQRQESPEIFHFWTAISLLSMALGRKCYLDKGLIGVIYPNQYIVLVAGSAQCAKTTAVKMGLYPIYEKAAIGEIVSSHLTTRKLSMKLHEAQQKTGESSLYIFSPELDNLINAESYKNGLVALLTDLYECWDERKWETATQGSDLYKNVFINFLGCTTPDALSKGEYLLEGGFAGRLILVYADTPRVANPWPRSSPNEQKQKQALIESLQEIAQISGVFTGTAEAQDYYSIWYQGNYDQVKEVIDKRLEGYYNRKRDHVFKLAMVLNAARSRDKLIDVQDIKSALDALGVIEKQLPEALVGVSYAKEVKHLDRVCQIIKDEKGITHSKLMRKMGYYANATQLKEYLVTLLEAHRIKMDAKGKERVYTIC